MQTQHEKTLLVALDTTQGSRAVFKETLVLATSIRARVVVVSVTPGYEGNMHRVFLNDSVNTLSEPFRKILHEASTYAASLGLQMISIHRTGKPEEEIIAVALEENADLIILGSTKHFHLERLLSGRITSEVIANGPCDVLLVPEGSEIRFNRLLVGINGSEASQEAGKRAVDVAKSYGSEIYALFAIDLPYEIALRYRVMKDAELEAKKILQSFQREVEQAGITVHSSIQYNTVEKCITEYARKNEINLIILGSHDESGLFEMFTGSAIERTASLSPCPILVAKKIPAKGSGQEHCFTSSV